MNTPFSFTDKILFILNNTMHTVGIPCNLAQAFGCVKYE